jgi:hypothetical protein
MYLILVAGVCNAPNALVLALKIQLSSRHKAAT